MILYDYECPCGNTFEALAQIEEKEMPCPKCGKQARRIISSSGHYCANQDAPWIRSVVDVVDKDSTAPHVVEFRNNPTRENWKKWMKGEGIRPMEGDEKPRPLFTDEDRAKINRECADRLFERRGIEIHTR